MARPAKFDRREALAATMNAIWENGFELSSVKTLSELVGITRSSFYNAFGSREGLMREAILEYAAHSPDAPLYGCEAVGVLPLLNAVFRDICRVRAGDPKGRGCLIVNTVCELCPDTQGLGAKLAELVVGSVTNLERLLELARTGDEISRESDVHALALALQNLMLGLNVLCKVVRREDELWLLTRTTLEGLDLYREPANA